MAEETEQPPVKLTVDQFAEKIKAKYPDYAHIDNITLAKKIVEKYPDYGNSVDFTPEKKSPVGNVAPNGLDLSQGGLPTSQSSQNNGTPSFVQPNSPADKSIKAHNDPHTNAIKVAQQQQQGQPEKVSTQPKDEESITDKVANALYLPSFNKGFNDLVVKPFIGAGDFVGRTVDKTYQAITGEKTPSWLYNTKGDVITKLSKNLDDAYAQRDKPKNIVSEMAEGAMGSVPLVASLFTGEGEVSLATKAPQFISRATKILAGTAAANAYKDATDQKKGYLASLKDAGEGVISGAQQGMTLDAQMLLGGALGKGVVNKIVEKGLLKGGKAGEAAIHALSTATVFGGTGAAQDLLSGKDVDSHEALKNFGMGLMFEAIPVAKGLNDEIKARGDEKKLNDTAAQQAVMATAASNLHGESVLRTLMTTPKEQLLAIDNNIKDSHETLYANSIEQGMKAYDEKNPNEKRSLIADQLLLKTQGDVKFIAGKDNSELMQEVANSPELEHEQKIDLLDKLQTLSKPNEPENVQNNESFLNHEQNKDSLTINPSNDESSSEKGGEKSSPETESGQKEAQLPAQEEVVNPDGDKKPSDTTKLSDKSNELLSSALDEYHNADDSGKADMVKKVQDQLSKHEKGENIGFGFGLDEDYVNAGKEFLKQVSNDNLSKNLNPKEHDEANTLIKDSGFDATTKDIQDYEQQQRDDSSQTGTPTPTDAKDVQPTQNDGTGNVGKTGQGTEVQGEETTTKPKISEKAKTLADKIRALKSDRSTLHDGLLGIPVAIYDGALETAATIIEQGGKLADAIQAAVEHIRDKSDQKDEDKIKAALTESLNEAGISDIEPKQDKNPLGHTDPEMIEANNAYMDAKVAGKFGTEVLDAMISKLQDTSLKNIIDKVKEKIKASPEFLSKVRKRVMENQSGNEEDAAALLMDQYHLKGQEEALMKQINEETDPVKLADLQKQLSKTLDDISDNAMANRALGRSASTIFRFRQVAIDQSANLHDMRQQFMASEGVKSLTPEQEEHIKKQYQAIKEAEQALKEAREEHQKTLTENERLQAENDALKKIINDAKQKHSDKTVTTADALTRIRKDLDGSKQRLKELVFGHTNSLGILHPEIYKELKNIVAKKAEEIYVKTKASIDLNKLVKHVLDEIKDVAPDITERDIRDAISGNHEGIKRKPKTELQKNIAELKRQAKIIQQYQDYIDGGDEPKRISKEDKEMLDQLREERKSHADDLDAKAWNVRKYKQTLRNIKDIEGKIDRKEYTLPGKEAKKFDKSKKLTDAEYTLALRKFQWEKERRLALLKNRPLIEKIADVILSLQRFNALSHVTTLVKLAGAVTDATLLFPFRLVIQHITAKMSPKSMVGIISGKVRRQSIAAYYSDFVERVQWKNIKQQLQGVDHADIMYGHPYYGESDGIGNKTKILSWTNNFLQMPGRIHGIEKSFLKYPEKAFARKQLMMGYLEKYNEIQKQLQDKSLSPADQVKLENDLAFYDLSNDDVMNRVESLATAHGNWSIFMQKNHFTDGVGNFFRQKGILGALMKSEIPIIKIPANWANRYFLMQAGLIQAFTGKRNFALKGAPLEFPGLIHHLLKGTDNMTEDQKELFSKALTYGTMGASAYVLGYMGRQVIQRNEDGSIDIAGHYIGKNWLDHPIVENYISGATFGQYMDNNEGEHSAGTYISGFVRSDMEAVKKMPYTQALQYGFVSSLIQALGAKNKDKGVDIATNAWDKKLAGMFSPGFMIDLAKMQDEDIFGDPVKRKPTNLLEHFEMNIPGLRKNVPEKE